MSTAFGILLFVILVAPMVYMAYEEVSGVRLHLGSRLLRLASRLAHKAARRPTEGPVLRGTLAR